MVQMRVWFFVDIVAQRADLLLARPGKRFERSLYGRAKSPEGNIDMLDHVDRACRCRFCWRYLEALKDVLIGWTIADRFENETEALGVRALCMSIR